MNERGTVVVAEASNAVEAGMWIDALDQAGIEARTFERSVSAALGGPGTSFFASYPVLVRAEHISQARNIISELSGGAVLAPVRDDEDVRESQRKALTVVGAIVVGVLMLALLARLTAG